MDGFPSRCVWEPLWVRVCGRRGADEQERRRVVVCGQRRWCWPSVCVVGNFKLAHRTASVYQCPRSTRFYSHKTSGCSPSPRACPLPRVCIGSEWAR